MTNETRFDDLDLREEPLVTRNTPVPGQTLGQNTCQSMNCGSDYCCSIATGC
jgi:hypothetical protein